MAHENQSGKMWSGRFREPLDTEFEAWQRSIVFDWRLLDQEIAASKAHASALCAAGILTKVETAQLREALDAIGVEFASEAGKARVRDHSSAEDIHHFVELKLADRIGPLGLKLHTGRSRNEQIATDLRLYVRAQIELVIDGLATWANALVDKAYMLATIDFSCGEHIPESIGHGPDIAEVVRRVHLVAPHMFPVLIEGLNGPCNEFVAESLHRLSARSLKPFVTVNCATSSEAELEVELFGQASNTSRGLVKGCIELAEGGTLFLNEISQMPQGLQLKLLRVLEKGELQRLGNDEILKVNVRIIAASRRALAEAVHVAGFFTRLYYRLAVFLIHTTSLAEHFDELPQYFAQGVSQRAREPVLVEAVMPSYTHLQRAEPVLAAHWLLAYVEMALRDASRLADCAKRLNLCPLGSGAVAGATLALDRSITAQELGFAAPTANSMDATSDRDFILEYLQSLTFVGLHLSRFAEEITLFATAEFGFVNLPEAFSTGSSAMPQKKNPDLTELLRAKVARLNGAAQTVTLQLKGLPLAYNKDMQETQEPAFAADFVPQMLKLVARFTAALQFNFGRMRQAAQSGYLNAMAAATYLVHKGVPFRIAHEKVGNSVRYALEKGVELNDLTLAELHQFGQEFGEDFFDAIALDATLDCHDVVGGTARARVSQALVAASERIAALQKSNAAEAAHAGA